MLPCGAVCTSPLRVTISSWDLALILCEFTPARPRVLGAGGAQAGLRPADVRALGVPNLALLTTCNEGRTFREQDGLCLRRWGLIVSPPRHMNIPNQLNSEGAAMTLYSYHPRSTVLLYTLLNDLYELYLMCTTLLQLTK